MISHLTRPYPGTKRRNKHLYFLNHEPLGRPIFIIPGVGGKTDRFRMFGKVFRGVCPVYGLDMMGTRKAETPFKSIEEIAACNIRWMREVQPEGPYRLVGQSFGAYIIYEMARQLEDAGELLDFLVILDQSIGLLAGPGAGIDSRVIAMHVMEMARDYYENFSVLIPPYPDWSSEIIAQLVTMPFEHLVPFISSFLSKKLPEKARRIEYVSRLINIRLYNSSIAYIPNHKISAEVVVFKAAGKRPDNQDETLGWSSYANDVQVFTVAGNHFNMVYGNKFIPVAKHLKQIIKTADQEYQR